MKIENRIARCGICNRLLMSYPTIIKPSKPKTKIPVSTLKPIRYDFIVPISNDNYKTSTVKELNKESDSKEDSLLFLIIQAIVQLFVAIFLIKLALKLIIR